MSGIEATTSVSSKGQVVLPKALRDLRRWAAGTRLIASEHPEGVLLRAEAPKRLSTLADVVGCVAYAGPAKTLADMERGIADGATQGE